MIGAQGRCALRMARTLLLAVVGFALWAPAQAEIYKCRDGSGKLVLRDTRCTSGETAMEARTAITDSARNAGPVARPARSESLERNAPALSNARAS